ncbi:MFS transporter [Microbacterium oxydans]|uniref:Putative proline/betaine transporter n=1 Tax=Microbacterium oxydans TaxID=82380 RepID=A0A0F0LCK1_9MICO|nr:MFS transporter [Microbacterium oxydans]KJL29266.1 Proline/betaine transporter [Microbacterium oxydans]
MSESRTTESLWRRLVRRFRPAPDEPRRLTVEDVTVVDRPMLRRAVAGTVVGNLMEWYDIGVYGYLAVIIGRAFLPDASAGAQSLFSLGVFAVTFVARPLGGIVLGQLGDRMGRQRVLAFTLIMMAAATFLIGVLPDFSVIGIWAPILLIVLKLAQGFSTGGEYAGATTFITEYAPDRRRGFYASLLDLGSYMGFAIGAAFVSILQLTLSAEVMQGFAWRIPFLVALPLGLIAIYFRLKIEDTPAFQEAQDAAARASDEAQADAPKGVLALIRAYWRELLTAFVLVAAANTVGYALTSYMPTYLTGTLGYDEVHGTLLTLPVLVAMALCIPLTGRLSDRIGRRKVLFIGSISAIVLAVPAFLFMMHGEIWSTVLGLVLLAFPVTFYVANLASSLPALFPTSSRYGGMGISYNLAVALFAGTAPVVMEALVQLTGSSLAPAFYVIGTSIAGFIAVVVLKESARRPLPGAMPSVQTEEEAVELVEGQDDNPDLDLDELFPERTETS